MTEKTVIALDKKVRMPDATFIENGTLDVADGKILCAHAEAYVVGQEALQEEFRVQIKTVFFALVLTEDNKCEQKTASFESSRLLSQKGLNGSTKGDFSVKVERCSYSEKSGEMTAEETLSGWYIQPVEANVLPCSDDLVCRTEKHVASRSDVVLTNHYQTCGDEMRMPIRTILDCSATAIINDVLPGEGSFRAEGETTLRVLALTDNDQYLSQVFSHPFAADVVASCESGSNIDVNCTVVRCDPTLSDGDARAFSTDIEISLAADISTPVEIEVVTDCYSVEKEVVVKKETVTFERGFCTKTLSDKASDTLETGNVVNEIYACVYPYVKTAKALLSEGVTVDGSIATTVLFADENNLPSAKEMEIPFSVRYNGEYPCGDLYPTVKIRSISARLKTGSAIDVTVEYAVTVRGSDEKSLSYLSEATLTDDKLPDEAAICLYPVKPGEDLFDVAKAMNCREETLLKLNPELTLPLVGGEKILLYNEIVEE